MELLEQLELVDVQYENDSTKAILMFLDEDRGEIRNVVFNKKSYDNGAFIDDPEKAQKCEEWSQEYFGESFDTLTGALGQRHDIYAYERFNSLWESNTAKNFPAELVGSIVEAKITEIYADTVGIKIKLEYDGEIYESKMGYSLYLEVRGQWVKDPIKERKQYEKFEKKFGVPFEEREKLYGTKVMVEIKKAFGKFIYSDIKKLTRKK